MEFCPKCGSMMASKEEKGKRKLVCRKCGFEKASTAKVHIVEEKVRRKPMDDVVVVREEDSAGPVVKVRCSRCGNEEAVWWIKQMRSGDEPPTIFYRCTKCKHTWRQY